MPWLQAPWCACFPHHQRTQPCHLHRLETLAFSHGVSLCTAQVVHCLVVYGLSRTHALRLTRHPALHVHTLAQEYVNGQLKNKYGDAFIRGNNGE